MKDTQLLVTCGAESLSFMQQRKTSRCYRQLVVYASVLNQLSKPIADALRLIKQLGIRYVWVDTLCIMQDNPRAQSLVDSMGLIFQNSYLTICATDGEDGRAGLLALNTSSRLVQPHTGYYSKEVGLMVSHLTETYIQKSSLEFRELGLYKNAYYREGA